MTGNRLQEILKDSHYQTFDFDSTKRDSRSKIKYDLSRLDSFDIKGKNILDVGCNAGYFLFKLQGKQPDKLIGIDLGEKFIRIANELNEEYFCHNNIQFIFGDFFTYKFELKFDLIICFSTFHYFGERQVVFFSRCREMMNEDAILLLEVEEYPINEKPIIDTTARSADKKQYHYPNELMMKEFVKGGFIIEDKYASVKQGGSLYARCFYKLRKV